MNAIVHSIAAAPDVTLLHVLAECLPRASALPRHCCQLMLGIRTKKSSTYHTVQCCEGDSTEHGRRHDEELEERAAQERRAALVVLVQRPHLARLADGGKGSEEDEQGSHGPVHPAVCEGVELSSAWTLAAPFGAATLTMARSRSPIPPMNANKMEKYPAVRPSGRSERDVPRIHSRRRRSPGNRCVCRSHRSEMSVAHQNLRSEIAKRAQTGIGCDTARLTQPLPL